MSSVVYSGAGIGAEAGVGAEARAGARSFPDAPPRLAELMLSREAHLFLRARNNLLEVLEARGMDVAPLTAESPEEVATLMENPLNFTYFVKEARSGTGGEVERKESEEEEGEDGDDARRRCKVFFAKSVSQILGDLEKVHIDESHPERLRPGKDEALIIIFGELSETAIRSVIMKSKELNLQIDAVHILHLQFNPLKHTLVPEYEPVPMYGEKDKEIIKASSVRKRRQLPLIRRDDIIARLLGLRPDQLVIVRNRGPTGRHTFVRLCVE